MTENEMVGWYHQLNGHEFEQTPGDSEGKGGRPRKELAETSRQEKGAKSPAWPPTGSQEEARPK